MASAMALMKKMEINTPAKGVTNIALDAGVGFGVSYGIGQTYHRHSDKWWGKNIARIVAGAGKAVAIGFSVASGGHQTFLGNMFNTAGQAGVNAIGLERGLTAARKATGKKAVLVPSDTDVKKIAGASDMTSIGALGRAQPGRGLSWDQIEELAQGR